ncbi:MAG: FHA domain-containing protein [Betaproteobacteria bacterium]|nr:FHA domain-containing protein [Betaproteobacteria bacterium]
MSTDERAIVLAEVLEDPMLKTRLGTTEAMYLIERYIKRMERTVEACNGNILVVLDNSMLVASFDTAESMLYAVVQMQQRVTALPPDSGVKLNVRIGAELGVAEKTKKGWTGNAFEAAMSLRQCAGAGQIFVGNGIFEALPEDLRTTVLAPVFLPSDNGLPANEKPHIIYEIEWQNDLPSQWPPSRSSSPSPKKDVDVREAPVEIRLVLHHQGREITLSPQKKQKILMGRDGGQCEIVLSDRRASRVHARIEYNGEYFVLIDQSSNGTYLTAGGNPEVLVHRSEMGLFGRGCIAFVLPRHSGDVELVEFEHF